MDANETPIEPKITPAMLDAGMAHLRLYEPGEDSADFREYTVAAIYRSMDAAKTKAA